MIKVSVFYPYKDDAAFNMDYYVNRHVPMVRETIGAACKGTSVDQGLAGGAPGSHPTYIAIGHLLIDTLENFQKAFAEHGAMIMADIPNYTAIEPIIQISEVKA